MHQLFLFGENEEFKPWIYHSDFLDKEEANELLMHCLELNWQQHYVERAGFRIPNPRLECIYGNKALYKYGQVVLESEPCTEILLKLIKKVSDFCDYEFNYLIGNYYRHGNDSIGWHSDNKDTESLNGVIASLSLGQMRLFQIKENQQASKAKSIWLEHGSLLIMKPGMQRTHVHRIPKVTKGWCGERINLTFRASNA